MEHVCVCVCDTLLSGFAGRKRHGGVALQHSMESAPWGSLGDVATLPLRHRPGFAA